MAARIVARVADEVVAFATAALIRLGLTDQGPDVVLGGGLMRAASLDTIQQIKLGIQKVCPTAMVVVSQTGPIVGAALLGLDELGAGGDAVARIRAELHDAFMRAEHAASEGSDGRAIAAGTPAHRETVDPDLDRA